MSIVEFIKFEGITPKLMNLLNYDKLICRINQQDKVISLLQKLDWSLPEDEQESAMIIIMDMFDAEDYGLLIIAGNKNTWFNAVRILKAIGYPKNKNALPSLTLLLQDLSWPGAEDSMYVLKEAGKEALIPLLEIVIESAADSSDFIWLAGMKQFVAFAQLKKSDFFNQNIYDLLQYAEW